MMRTGGTVNEWKVIPIAADASVVFQSPDPATIYLEYPAIVVFPGGRIIVAMDLSGPGVRKLPGAKGKIVNSNRWLQGKLFTSSDKGQTWTPKHEFPFCNACFFRDSQALYLFGHRGNILTTKSSDGAETWGHPVELTDKDETGCIYSRGAANALFANGCIYLALMKTLNPTVGGHSESALAPVVARARQGANLANKGSWTFSEPATTFRDLVPLDKLDYFGVPSNSGRGDWVARHPAHIVHINGADHVWHNSTGQTLHLLAPTKVHRSNIAAIARIMDDAGRITLGLQPMPEGKKIAFLPLPGGNMPFDILYDETTSLYWLLSSLITDSMTTSVCDECRRLQLSFSKNLVDWRFAGCVTAGSGKDESYYAPRMAVRGNDLCVVCCSSDACGKRPGHAGRVMFFLVPNFRELVF